MKNKKIWLSATIIFILLFCLTLPFFFGMQIDVSIDKTSSAGTNSESSETPSEAPDISTIDAIQVWENAEAFLKRTTSFSSATTGHVDTQVLFFNYRQTLSHQRTVLPTTSFLQWTSSGSLLNSGLQVFHTEEKTLLRTGTFLDDASMFWSETPVAISHETYSRTLGNHHEALSPYIISKNSVSSSSFVSSSDEKYIFSYQVNEAAFEPYSKFLQTLNSLEQTPVLKSAKIFLEVDKDFRPLSVRYEENYTIQMNLIGETSCSAAYQEVFSYEANDLSEESGYFHAFSDLELSKGFPPLPGGYDLLFSLFGNNRSYNLDVTLSGQSIPLHVNFDSSRGIIHLQGENFALIYTDNRYYFSYEEIRASTDAKAFEEQILPLSTLYSQTSRETPQNSLPSLMESISVKMENGMIILDSSDEQIPFHIEINTATMTLHRADLSTDLLGSEVDISMVQSPVRGTIPDLTLYKDITPSMSALSMMGELARNESTYYHLSVGGAFTYQADAILTTKNGIAASIISVKEDTPLSFYLNNESATLAFGKTQIKGQLNEFFSLISLLGTTQSNTASPVLRNKKAELVAEEGKLELRLEESRIIFQNDSICYRGGGFDICLKKNPNGFGNAKTAPHSSNIVQATSLREFLSNSIYTDMIGAGTVFCDLTIAYNGQAYPAKGCISFGESLAIGISATVDGQSLGIVWRDDVLYVSHPTCNLFVSGDQMDTLTQLLNSFADENNFLTLANDNIPEYALSITCNGNQLCLNSESFSICLEKQTFTLQMEGVAIAGSNITTSPQISQIVMPEKNSCIDIVQLLTRVKALLEKDGYSFTGTFSNESLFATINTLCFQLNDSRQLNKLLAEIAPEGPRQAIYRLYYDGEFIYLDAEQVKLFAWADQLLPPLQQLFATEQPQEETDSFTIDLSSIKSLTYQDETLTVETADGRLCLSWKNGQPDRVTISIGDMDLRLAFAEMPQMEAPALDGYVDVSTIGDLLASISRTIDTGSFSFDGTFDLNLLSIVLTDIHAQGAVSLNGTEAAAHIMLDVPYLYGITSNNVPLLQGFNPLLQCNISSEIYLANNYIYVSKTIVAKYGLFSIKTISTTEQRCMPLEQFLSSPYDLLSFAFNLTDGSLGESPEAAAKDATVLNPLKKFSSNGNVYTLEFYPEAVFPAADQILLTMETDGNYLIRTDIDISLSVLSLSGKVDLMQYREAVVTIPDQNELSGYLPFHE